MVKNGAQIEKFVYRKKIKKNINFFRGLCTSCFQSSNTMAVEHMPIRAGRHTRYLFVFSPTLIEPGRHFVGASKDTKYQRSW